MASSSSENIFVKFLSICCMEFSAFPHNFRLFQKKHSHNIFPILESIKFHPNSYTKYDTYFKNSFLVHSAGIVLAEIFIGWRLR